ncbi:Prolyl-tRNA synthetase class IIa bacterial-type [Penicillium bovifimosum]|uniref:proline--tRNA ligase n=1 Tax=Penicillium bovifimosum TaxID=126998 RepID=A0A9W9H1J4_9EURO|nr:Prolyl-tRNA synthetase class IIa bacterial-type [Penicillium bovifimosum]KAJ5135755.1 Prolyl-tRNA synthetase class IIa bacterial-type [Penicillium bovifimosum]
MISGLRPFPGRITGRRLPLSLRVQQCNLHVDGRSRVSNFWIPTGGISKKPVDGEKEDANDLLIRGGFLRQAYSGVFHMLPLGLRVQDKLERLIDKHMRSLGASRVSLSSISSQELWKQSGRFTEGSELFHFKDRKETPFLLAPTHEEEITTLVGNLTTSYKSLPLRVYQISRKYRDEARPRQGLLRGREFIMKDLYTFDYSVSEALKTYDAVRNAYTNLFNELKIPYLVAAADSGNMGGSLSHEYHFISPKGEDEVVSCSHCEHVYNEELADGKTHSFEESEQTAAPGFQTDDTQVEGGPTISTGMWMAISHDSNTIVRGWHPKFSMQSGATEPIERHVNSHAVKAIATAAGIDLDLSVENPLQRWTDHVKKNKSSTQKPRVLDLYDSQVRVYQRPPLSDLLQRAGCTVSDIEYSKLDRFPGTSNKLSLVRVHDGDKCSKCAHGSLTSHSAVELGHTFHLGTRYSEVLNASVSVNSALLEGSSGSGDKSSAKEKIVPMQMGCHGIGVSRMISAVANRLADSKGLNWPRAMAPYEVVVVSGKALETVADQVYDNLTSDVSAPVDVILDDRDKGMGWKLGDADLIGYPIIVVVGNGWKKHQTLEVQCRRLDVKEDVSLDRLRTFVESLLTQL